MSIVAKELEPLRTTKTTVARALADLEGLGIAQEKTGRPRNRVYVYREYLDILNSDTIRPAVTVGRRPRLRSQSRR